MNIKKNNKMKNNNESESNKKNNKYNLNNEHNLNNIKSENNYDCIGPCYPANVIYYNPTTLTPIKSIFPTCPINKKVIDDSGNKKYIYADKCKITDINDDYLYFDIFDDSVQIANSSNNFLKQIYNINNIADVIYFFDNIIDEIPIYSQKRILKAIYEVYYKFVEFPKLFFSDRILKILKEIYQIKKKISNNEILTDLDNVYSKSSEFYNYFLDKYN